MSEDKKEKKTIEVVTGDGKDLNISQVYNHIATDKPKSAKQNKKNIVIPKSKNH